MSPLAVVVSVVCFLGALLSSAAFFWSLHQRGAAQRLELRRRVGANEESSSSILQDLAAVELPEGPGTHQSIARWVQLQLRAAGDGSSVSWFVVRSALAGGSGLMLTMLFLDGPGQLAGVLLGGIPLVVLRARGRQRRAALIRLMPATLDLIIRSLRAGHALSDALCTAAEEAPEPLGVELLQLTEQHRLGRPLRDCFDHLVERNPEVFDLRLMGSAVMLQRETGANLIEMLEHLAETIRERLLFTHKLAAVTAEVRVSATILASLPFLVTGALLLLQPRYLLPLITTGLGQSLLTGAGLSLLLGLGLMRSLAQVRV